MTSGLSLSLCDCVFESNCRVAFTSLLMLVRRQISVTVCVPDTGIPYSPTTALKTSSSSLLLLFVAVTGLRVIRIQYRIQCPVKRGA